MNTFALKIIACDKIFYDGRCESLIVPAMDGEKAVWAHHENMVIAMKIGETRFKLPGGTWVTAVTGTGFVQVANNRATVLVDTAERPEDIDIIRAREAEARAKEQLRQKQSLVEYHQTQAALARAMTRLKAAGKYNQG